MKWPLCVWLIQAACSRENKYKNVIPPWALEEVEADACRLHTWKKEVLLLMTLQWLLLIPRNISLPDPLGTGSRTVCCRLVPPAAATLCQDVLRGDIFGSFLVLILPWLLWWIIRAASLLPTSSTLSPCLLSFSPLSFLSHVQASCPPESLPSKTSCPLLYLYICICRVPAYSPRQHIYSRSPSLGYVINPSSPSR